MFPRNCKDLIPDLDSKPSSTSEAGARQGLLVRGADVLERLAGKENPQFLVLHLSTMKNCCCSCRRWAIPSASNAASIILLGNKLSQVILRSRKQAYEVLHIFILKPRNLLDGDLSGKVLPVLESILPCLV
ncbi:hypothetical protein ACFXTO_043808 [Malus domestica]